MDRIRAQFTMNGERTETVEEVIQMPGSRRELTRLLSSIVGTSGLVSIAVNKKTVTVRRVKHDSDLVPLNDIGRTMLDDLVSSIDMKDMSSLSFLPALHEISMCGEFANYIVFSSAEEGCLFANKMLHSIYPGTKSINIIEGSIFLGIPVLISQALPAGTALLFVSDIQQSALHCCTRAVRIIVDTEETDG